MQILDDLQEQIATYYDNLVVLLPKLFIGLILMILFFVTSRFIRRRLARALRKKADDPLLIDFISNVMKGFNFIFGIMLFLYVIGLSGIVKTVLGAASVGGLVLGFAFKDIGENFLAGVIMAFNRPFRIGDTVETNGVTGSIVGLTLRETHLKTFDGKDVYIPNGQILKAPLFNFTIDGFLRKQFVIGVDYDSDLPRVRKLIVENLKDIGGIIQDERPPQTILTELGASTVNVTVQYWIDTFDKSHSGNEIQSMAMNAVVRGLEKEGINMPGDIIELKNYKDQSLSTGEKKLA